MVVRQLVLIDLQEADESLAVCAMQSGNFCGFLQAPFIKLLLLKVLTLLAIIGTMTDMRISVNPQEKLTAILHSECNSKTVHLSPSGCL